MGRIPDGCDGCKDANLDPTDHPCCDCNRCNEHSERDLYSLAIDPVNHPVHYADLCSLECIEAMEIAFGSDGLIYFCLCNAFKYVWRCKNKNGKQDLEKAKWYLNKAHDLGLYSKVMDQYSALKKILQKLEKELDK